MWNYNKKKILKGNKNGFVILIAVLVSMILLSIGMFIASVSVREIALSSSTKESQRAFYAADAVLECALLKEFKKDEFSTVKYENKNDVNTSLECNNHKFSWETSKNTTIEDKDGNNYQVAEHVYYVSFADVIQDEDGNGLYSNEEIKDSVSTERKPYVKLIVQKATDYSKQSKMRVYGHNFRKGSGVIERAIEVVW